LADKDIKPALQAAGKAAPRLEGRHLIMDKPLPMIIDEIDISIQEADRAAAEARQAAEQARLAGERAAEEVLKRIRKLFLKMAQDITDEMKEGAAK
jgi:hypothetical protein